MGVISAERMRENETGQSDNKGRWTYTVPYLVKTNTKFDTIPIMIRQAAGFGLPQRGAFLLGDVSTQLARHTVSRGEEAEWWIVNCIFEVPPDNEDRNDRFTHPLNRPPRYRIEEENVTVAVDKDRNGDAILNTAGETYDEGVEVDRTRIILVAEKNVKTLDEIIANNQTYVGKVNSDTYRGQDPRTWLVRSITSSEIKSEENITYYTQTHRIAYEPEKWNAELLNRGFKARPAAGQPAEMVTERTDRDSNEKVPVSEPVLLDADGVKTTTANFTTFEVIKQISFANIGV